jgi:hypothetical protein
MAIKYFDRVKETSSSTGTGAFTVSGTETGFVSFGSVLSVADTFYYCIQSKTPGEWEIGIGTYSAENTITRTIPLVGSAATPVDFSAGDKDVFITVAAALFGALPVKTSGAEITTGTDDAKFVTAKALADAGNVLASSVQTLTNKSIYLPDGEGLNYQLATAIASNNLTVALKTFAGTDPSATDVAIFSVGASMLNVSAALSVAVNAAYADIFAWDTGKIQANDAQLFVYLINNNGTPQIGVSPCPTLLTVATNYYDASAQTGAAGHTNIVMSGTRNATNSCRVIGRINVNQADNNNWQAPGTSLIINRQIFETDWMNYTPTYTGYSTPPATNISQYKLIKHDVMVDERETANGTSNSTSTSMTAPILTFTLTNKTWYGIMPSFVDNDVVVGTGISGSLAISSNSQTIILYKVPAVSASWTASGGKRVLFNGFVYRVS